MCDVSFWICSMCTALPVLDTISYGGLADGSIDQLDKMVELFISVTCQDTASSQCTGSILSSTACIQYLGAEGLWQT